MIRVIDSIMGSGKTSYIIQELNNSHKENESNGFTDGYEPKRYIVATPYLDQIDAIKSKVPHGNEVERTEQNKSKNLVKLIEGKTEVIFCTHELLKGFSQFELLKDYILIIDESPDVIEIMSDNPEIDSENTILKEDLEILKKAELTQEDANGFIEWKGEEYKGLAYKKIYPFLRNKSLISRNNCVYKLLPTELFQSAKETYICTYLFEGQNMFYYCKHFGLEFDYWHVEEINKTYVLQEGQTPKEKREYKIDVYEGKYNDIGKTWLSKNWYRKKAKKDELEYLGKSIYNYLKTHLKTKTGQETKTEQVIWTSFVSYAEQIAKGRKLITFNRNYKESNKCNFVPCSKRATNDYKERTKVVYAVNRFQNPQIVRFFAGQDYNQELFALQEMLQFIWRSAIRENEPIHLYVPSERMRNLLKQWLNGEL